MTLPKFILIDDSKIDLFVVETLIKKTIPGSSVVSFNEAIVALDYLKSRPEPVTGIILLDIQMPVMDGFQFLEEFHRLDSQIKNRLQIYILTSSHNESDINRGKSNTYVTDVLIKPLNRDTLLNLPKNNPST